ncbi:MAG: DivIVA domain-containing protein [Oscillospiraceae bacterium]
MLKPSNILDKKFEKTAMFGYKIEDVDSFFVQISEEYRRLCEENEILEQKISVLANKIEEYRNAEDSVSSVLIEAKKLGDNIIEKAKEQASSILREAKSKAENSVSNIKMQISKEQNALLRMQREVAGFKAKISNIYKSHLDLINKIPDMPKEMEDLSAGELFVENKEIKEELSLEMEKPDRNEPVTKQMNIKEVSSLKSKSISEKRFINVSTNEDGDIVSKFGVLKFGEGHGITSDKDKKEKKHLLFKNKS